jgi:hypothetical protein
MQPEDWQTFDAKSLLGGVLLAQRNYAEAEPLLVQGYEGMKQRQARFPAEISPRLTEALERLVRLYDDWGKNEAAARWRKEATKGPTWDRRPEPLEPNRKPNPPRR